jgi:CheY-like chemotaxis protein
VVHDGEEAVIAAAELEPELVLLDIGLPGRNGYEAAREIRAMPGGDRMVLAALTGWGQEADRQRAFAAGFDHHLTKPLEPAVLERLLANLPSAADRPAAQRRRPRSRPGPIQGAGEAARPTAASSRRLIHDLRGSLNALLLSIQVMDERSKDDPMLRQLTRSALASGNELRRLVDRLSTGSPKV